MALCGVLGSMRVVQKEVRTPVTFRINRDRRALFSARDVLRMGRVGSVRVSRLLSLFYIYMRITQSTVGLLLRLNRFNSATLWRPRALRLSKRCRQTLAFEYLPYFRGDQADHPSDVLNIASFGIIVVTAPSSFCKHEPLIGR